MAEVQELPLVKAIQPFDADVQSGIMQAGPAHLEVLAFDLNDGVGKSELITLLQEWTSLARNFTQGKAANISNFYEVEMVEAVANLTVTAGFGERIFDLIGKSDLKPEGLHDIPAFDHDNLQPQWGQSDLVIQICCDDPVTLFTTARMMIKVALPVAHVKWMQKGFGHAFGAAPAGATPRNPMGSIDGTVNPHSAEEWDEQVWIDSDQAYLKNSSIMVVRRIALDLDVWEKLDEAGRSRVIGRDYHTGAPLSGGTSEFDEEDMDAKDAQGNYLIDRHSHLALSREQDGLPNDALRRRAYAYDDALNPHVTSSTNSGLVWIAFQKNPDKQFTAIQKRLDASDLLNEYAQHIGSAVYWIVPGTRPDTYWGQALMEA
ncbi:MAG: Dyp-type peroxidase [Actinomycetaceae bacterium]|nr:Dyp-type peroxidase [Arcanobacterium sp.]MDD7686315.1 Dyp-type peroxidase [Actinomycetaceae bacterium]MDY5274172.1 Dyp-type peroxidase [Arcanobacterium sp.]